MSFASTVVAPGRLPERIPLLTAVETRGTAIHLCIYCGWVGHRVVTVDELAQCPKCSWGLSDGISRILVQGGGDIWSTYLPTPRRGLDARLVIVWHMKDRAPVEMSRFLRLFCGVDCDAIKRGSVPEACLGCSARRGKCRACWASGLGEVEPKAVGCSACGGTAVDLTGVA